ncbi:MAG: anthranilate 1,2-dioxygenase [Hyphomonas sp. BRH_c22]|uniref:Small terminal subunit of phenylpropionate dioxygenase n=1 Tax=Hyphomonas oceanitis SCH89 TaxID=1280953 RepID=A0A059G3L3_9PROT|nr:MULTISPECIES: aromatic-ring-hydroxylating dioxygenase subunit beta [Hyphomonadaceae]KDA01170.1 small terminal subunit of phenylpropionate dioxygenase [Hyphomonas oceanitis SCH89]KJS38360.1 MAG: anthranilate 1,2-dioxygenase [Hyphomonas sp. BRH_c22]RIJ16688.1 anthranilate 1,2-dioxygenase [Henriciella mobilis]RIJ21531.1 anthranilate 1,2-dioxygenase [Henriciella mobilis]|tara:strand:+ start:1392 stop:1871 length:480 start_codon:yes stop_codon:yes gene_type:complete
MTIADPVLQGLIDSLNAAYGLCLDDGRLEDWPEFFVEDCLYQVIARENVDNGLPAAVMYCDSKGMLVDRVVALRQANVFPEHFSRHLISRAVVTGSEGNTVTAEASYAVLQTRNDGETRIFNAGKYVDRFLVEDGAARLVSRTCVYDTHRIATLLATPI